MKRTPSIRSALRLTICATLAGGSLFSTCQTRIKHSVVDGSTTYLYSLFNPANFAEFLMENGTGDTGG
jgi:hypothetical protein